MTCRTLACATKSSVAAEPLHILNLHKDACGSDYRKNKSGCLLGEFFLFGNMNRLKLCDDLGNIYVVHRVHSLLECFAPLTVWKKHFDSMVFSWKLCISESFTFGENEVTTEVYVMEKVGTNSEVHMSLYKFAKDRLRDLVVPAKRSSRVLCIHLPKILILPENLENMVTFVVCWNLLKFFSFKIG